VSEPRRLTVLVCRGPTCGERRNSAALHEGLRELIEARGLGQQVTLGWETCFGHCIRGPNVLVYDTDEVRGWQVYAGLDASSAVLYNRVTPEELERMLDKHLGGGFDVRAFRRI
jgi:(2Fe-2S) ferredoxin